MESKHITPQEEALLILAHIKENGLNWEDAGNYLGDCLVHSEKKGRDEVLAAEMIYREQHFEEGRREGMAQFRDAVKAKIDLPYVTGASSDSFFDDYEKRFNEDVDAIYTELTEGKS